MLTVETIGRIRRERFVNGKTIRQIARDLRVSRNTVRKVLRSGETSFAYDREVQPLPKLGQWTADLDELLAGNATKAAREQLTRNGKPPRTRLCDIAADSFLIALIRWTAGSRCRSPVLFFLLLDQRGRSRHCIRFRCDIPRNRLPPLARVVNPRKHSLCGRRRSKPPD
jgi:transcriptional regulator with XRE-family HTH domain